MIIRKLSSSEKFFFSLIINAVIFGGVFGLRLLGLSISTVLLILATVISLEVVYLTIFMRISVNKNARGLDKVEKYIDELRENAEKNHTALIYISNQMKIIHHELDLLKKNSIFKPNGNNHPKLHV